MAVESSVIVNREDFDALLGALRRRGFEVVGPVERDGAIVYDTVTRAADLPAGRTDHQEAGRYRLEAGEGAALFGHVVGPHSWKAFLHPARLKLWESHREADGALSFEESDTAEPPRLAFLGVRSCELHAIAMQDRVFLENGFVDSHYQRRRERIFTIAVNCGRAADTCFCASMQTGPGIDGERTPYDLALTELLDESGHRFLMTAGSEVGAEVLAELPSRPSTTEEIDAAESIVARAAASQKRAIPDAASVPGLLLENLDSPRWDEVASRCLACANCTMVCPTCFCTTVEDSTDLTGDHAERWRRWDSCFTLDFTWMPGGSARQSIRSRYRQWLSHKLATWHEQFGSSGCVGCGRCIAWCPVGIDLTEEVAGFRAGAGGTVSAVQSGPPETSTETSP